MYRVATVLRRPSPMAYSKHMGHCCQSLLTSPEYQTDALIPHLVRSQELSRRVFDAFSYNDPSSSEMRGELIITLTSDAFNRELDRLDHDLPPHLRENSKSITFRFGVRQKLTNP
jgi:hypothetical protein